MSRQQTRRSFLKNAAAVCAATMLPTAAFAKQKHPNIIFILTDDQRYDFLSSLGHPWITTPHIDKLVKNSIVFENAYVTTSLCSPSRASILTGQYAHTHKVIDNDTPIDKNTPTFATELQKNGYRTAFIGKWHMGGGHDEPRPEFDHWISFKGQGPFNDPLLNINGTRVQKEGYTTDILTDYACEFIQENQQSDQPYCLYLSHKNVHEPFTPAERHKGRFKDLKIPTPDTFADTDENYAGKPQWLRRQRKSWHGSERDYNIYGDYGDFDTYFRRYSECMLSVDDSVGEITQALKKAGKLEETIIIYFSDNGYLMGEQGLIDKRVMYEPSIRVPMFVHAPAHFDGKTRSEFILNIDIAPTILELAGVVKPKSMHGESFLPLMKKEQAPWRNQFVYEYFCDPCAPQTPTILGLRTRQYSYMTYQGVWDQWELYDMEKDPDQKNNLLGDIKWGQDYGTFQQHVQRQNPELWTILKKLDEQLTQELAKTNGKRQPQFEKPASI